MPVAARPPCPVRVVGLRRGYRLKSLPQATPRQQATRSPELRRRRWSPDLPAQQPPQASTRQIVIVLPRWIVTAPPPCHADRSELARSSLVECPQSPGSSCVRSSPPTSPRPPRTRPARSLMMSSESCYRNAEDNNEPRETTQITGVGLLSKLVGLARAVFRSSPSCRRAEARRRRADEAGSDDDGAGRSQ